LSRDDIGKTGDISNLDEDDVLHIMKMRIVESYRWKLDIVEPISKELGISEDELEEILIKRLDMASLEALHPRYESSKHYCIKEKLHADLRLCWLSDVMNILSKEEAEDIKNKIASEILTEGKSYQEALEDGRKDLLEYLMR
jgi:energy-converting hydrogenase A subunit M